MSTLSMMDDASPEVLESMEDASIYMMRSANMITFHGGKLMSNARKEHQVLVLQQMIMRER